MRLRDWRSGTALIGLLLAAQTLGAAQNIDLTPRSWGPGEAALYDSLTRGGGRRVPLARGTRGMIAGTSAAAAVRSGLEALKQGGTAMDAALTHSIADIVLMAGCCVSHAGFMTMVYYEAATGKVHSMNAGWNTVRGETDPLSIPRNTPTGRSALVPGFMAGAEAAHKRFGKLPWAVLFQPAIYFAEEGARLDQAIGGMIAAKKQVLERLPATKAVFTRPDGGWYQAGDLFKQPALARTLRQVASQGASYMYRGEWAKRLVAAVQADGGKMTMEDLAAYKPIWSEPARTTFREYEAFAIAPPNVGGVNLLEALNLVEVADVRQAGHYTTSVDALDRLISIARVNDVMGTSIIAMIGPRIPLLQSQVGDLRLGLHERLTKAHARSVWATMQTPGWREVDQAVFELPRVTGSGHSDAVVAVDERGNVAAVLHTINTGRWGNTGIVIDGVSIADVGGYQQQLLARTRPGDRLPDPTNPLIVLKDGKPVLASSSIGVGLHEQTLLSIVNVLEYGFDPATAVDTGQFLRPVFAARPTGADRPAVPGSQVIAEGEFSAAMLSMGGRWGTNGQRAGSRERRAARSYHNRQGSCSQGSDKMATRGLRSAAPVLVIALPLLIGTIAAQEPATVELVPARAVAVAGSTTRFRAIVRDGSGKVLDQVRVQWFAVPYDVAKADTGGTVTAFRPAQVTVFARTGRLTATARLDVAERPLSRLTISSPEGTATVVGGVLQLEVRGATSVGDWLPDVQVHWRSRTPGVATVGPSGLVTGQAPGTVVIAAESGDVVTTTEITVRHNPVRSIVIGPPPAQVRAGDVVRLAATPLDARGGKVDVALLRWSVRGRGAMIDADGRFVAERPGSYPITVSVGSTSATTSIRVAPRIEPRRIELVARVRLPKDFQVGEIWPVGNAIYVCSNQARVYVFDISRPEQPVLTDSIMVDARIINDVSTTDDGKIGVLTREGASSRRNGLVFFDASDVYHPRILSEFTETVSGGVHSAFIYQHYVFATDDATGSLRIIDFGDPRNPRQIVRWEIPREISEALPGMKPERYLHDVYVKDGLAYLAYWRDGLVILDVGRGIKGGTIQDPKFVSQFRYNYAELYPPDFIAGTHAVFRDGNYVYITDEVLPGTYNPEDRDKLTTRGLMQVIDVSEIGRPRKVAEYDPVEFGAHNIWIENGVAYIGAWDGGARLVDVSGELLGDLREQGRVIGKLETTRADAFRPNQGLVWSAIPHRGFFYAGDKGTGLWVARLVEPKLVP